MRSLKIFFTISIIALCIFSLNSFVFSQSNTGTGPDSLFTILNEIEVNNPGDDVPNCEYVEVRGDENSNVPGTLYLLEVNGDGAQAGTIIYSINLTGRKFGSNGLITIAGPSLTSSFNQRNLGASNLGFTGCGLRYYGGQGTTYIQSSSINNSNGTVSFMLVKTLGSNITAATDLDLNNDGIIDNLPADATIVDAVGWKDEDSADFVYGGLDITPENTSGAPDAATRNHFSKIPFDAAAWFAQDIMGTDVNSKDYHLPTNPGAYFIEHITPGLLNLKTTAASATVAGRVVSSSGRGLLFVTVMITSNSLPEPLYATTNMFGRYQFEDLPVGDSYVLQVFSKRYTFDQSSMVISLGDNITDANFIGNQR